MSIPATDPVLNRRENIDAVDQDGETALIRAARDGDTSAIVDLIAEGADVNAANRNGWTPLMLASARGHIATVEVLIALGSDIYAADHGYGWTPLMFASDNGHTAIVVALLDLGADINAVNHRGTTALMIASRQGHTAAIAALIARGANINPINWDCDNALKLARESYGDHDANASIIEGGLKGLQDICNKRDAAVFDGLPRRMQQSCAGIIQDYDCDLTFDDFPPTSEFVRKSIEEDRKKQAERDAAIFDGLPPYMQQPWAGIIQNYDCDLIFDGCLPASKFVKKSMKKAPMVNREERKKQAESQSSSSSSSSSLSPGDSDTAPLLFSTTTTTTTIATTTAAPAVSEQAVLNDVEQKNDALKKKD